MVNLFKFEDYVEYLNALYTDLKSRRRMSAREFIKLLGYGSPSFLNELRARKRTIDPKRARTIGHRLGLNSRQIDYFEAMVSLAKAKDPEEKEIRLKHLKALQSVREITKLDDDWYTFFTNWRASALFLLFQTTDAHLSIKEIAELLDCSTESLRILLQLLERLQLLQHGPDGVVSTVDVVRTPTVIPIELRAYYKDLLLQAQQKIESLPVERRLVMGLMFNAAQEDLGKIREEIDEFLVAMDRKYGKNPNANQIYHMGIQCMPLLKKDLS